MKTFVVETSCSLHCPPPPCTGGMDYLQAGRLSTVLLVGVTYVDFTITILNDDMPEFQDQKFNVALLARVGYELGQPREAAVYIKDDDGQWSMPSLSTIC